MLLLVCELLSANLLRVHGRGHNQRLPSSSQTVVAITASDIKRATRVRGMPTQITTKTGWIRWEWEFVTTNADVTAGSITTRVYA